MRGLLLALSLAFAASASAQLPDKTISFAWPPGRASVVLPQLAKVIGTTLTTSRVTENEILQIQVKDVKVSDLMDRISIVANTSWRQEGAGFRLVRSDKQSREAQDANLKRRVEEWRALLNQEDAVQKQQPA